MTKTINLARQVSIVTPQWFSFSEQYNLLYLLHGYSLDHRQWGYITDLQAIADHYKMIIVCPDGLRSFFMNSFLNDGIQYATFFFNELVPYIHNAFKIDDNKIYISGASMGGFGALHLMLKRPDYFTAAGSSSGTASFDYTFWQNISRQYFQSDVLVNDLESILGPWPEAKDTWHQQSLINRIDEFKTVNKPIIIDCGTEDPVYKMNNQLMERLQFAGASFNTFSLRGDHSNVYWAKTLKYHLEFFFSLSNITKEV